MDSQTNPSTPESKLHFLDYWRIIRIRKTVILAVFLLVTITTTLVTFILPKSYASTVRIAVDKNSQSVGGLDGQKSSYAFDPYWIQTEFEKIQSKTMLHVVITNLSLNRRWAPRLKEEGDLKTDLTYSILKSQIDVRQSRNTSLISAVITRLRSSCGDSTRFSIAVPATKLIASTSPLVNSVSSSGTTKSGSSASKAANRCICCPSRV